MPQSIPGLVEPGNITNLYNRKILHNQDGSYSTTSSMSFDEDGHEVLIPTVVDGKRLSNRDAIAHYRQTGEHLGKFESPETADAYATSLHEHQAQMQPDHQTNLHYLSEAIRNLAHQLPVEYGNSEKIAKGVTQLPAGLASLAYGLDEHGKPEFNTYHPGIFDETASMGNFLPMGLRGISKFNRWSGASSYADKQEQLADWMERHLPDTVTEAPEKASRLKEGINREMGIGDPHGFPEQLMRSAGEMLGQVPLPGGSVIKSGNALKNSALKVIKAIPEYLGPTIKPSVAHYLEGSIGGGALGTISDLAKPADEDSPREALDDLSEKYPPGYASGGMTYNQPTGGMDWYNHYGQGPEFNWANYQAPPVDSFGSPAMSPGLTIPGVTDTQLATSLLRTGNQIRRGFNTSANQNVNTDGLSSQTGQQLDAMTNLNSVVNGGIAGADALSHMPTASSPQGSVTVTDMNGNLISGGAGALGAGLSAAATPAGTTLVTDLAGNVLQGGASAASGAAGAGSGAASAGSGVLGAAGTGLSALGAGYGAYNTYNAIRNKDPKGGLISGAGTGASIGSMVAPGIGTAIGAGIGAIVGGVGGEISANTWKPHLINQSGAKGVDQGNMAQMIANPQLHAALTLGVDPNSSTAKFLNNAFSPLGPVNNIADALGLNSQTPGTAAYENLRDQNPAGNLGRSLTADQVNGATFNAIKSGMQGQDLANFAASFGGSGNADSVMRTGGANFQDFVQNQIKDAMSQGRINPNDSGDQVYQRIVAPALDTYLGQHGTATGNWTKYADQPGIGYVLSDLSDYYLGQNAKNSVAPSSPAQSPQPVMNYQFPSNLSFGFADGGLVDYAGGGKVDSLMKMLEHLSLNPHATADLSHNMLEDPVDNIKYAANEAKNAGKISPETHATLNELVSKYLGDHPHVTDEDMIEQLHNLHQSLFGTTDAAYAARPVDLLMNSPKPIDTTIPTAHGVSTKFPWEQ